MLNEQHDNKTFSSRDLARYFSNEMSPEEMHAMEKAALEDPFLADAMEGYAEASFNQARFEGDMETLSAQLQKRVEHEDKRSKVVLLKRNNWWRIAAAVMLLAGSGALVYTLVNMSSENRAQVAKNETPAASLADTVQFSAPSDTTTTQTSSSLFKKEEDAGDNNQKNKTAPIKEVPASKEISAVEELKKEEATVSAATEKPADEPLLRQSRIRTEKTMAGAVPGVANREQEMIKDQAAENAKLLAPFAANSFNGRVVDPENKPIAGASVMIKNKNLGVSTDKDGNFNVILPDSNVQVQVGYVGYESRDVTLKQNLTDNRIVLRPSEIALSDVVVTGYNTQRRQSVAKKSLEIQATPVDGWPKYQAYLSNNKRIPASDSSLHGTVVISFGINKKGKPTDLKIEQSLTGSHDAEALRLVKEGPSWKQLKGKARGRISIAF